MDNIEEELYPYVDYDTEAEYREQVLFDYLF